MKEDWAAGGAGQPHSCFNFFSPRWGRRRSVALNPRNYPRYWPPVLCKWNPAVGWKNMVVNTLEISFCADHSWRKRTRGGSRERRRGEARRAGRKGGQQRKRQNSQTSRRKPHFFLRISDLSRFFCNREGILPGSQTDKDLLLGPRLGGFWDETTTRIHNVRF